MPQDPFNCVLARYFAAVMPTHPGVEEVAIGRPSKQGRFRLMVRQGRMPIRTINIPLSASILQFLGEFDAFLHRDLVDLTLCPGYRLLRTSARVEKETEIDSETPLLGADAPHMLPACRLTQKGDVRSDLGPRGCSGIDAAGLEPLRSQLA